MPHSLEPLSTDQQREKANKKLEVTADGAKLVNGHLVYDDPKELPSEFLRPALKTLHFKLEYFAMISRSRGMDDPDSQEAWKELAETSVAIKEGTWRPKST
jgi:hypothetical protein